MKKIAALLIGFAVMLSVPPVAAESTPEIVIDSLSVDNTGHAEVIGHIDGGVPNESSVTCLVMVSEWSFEDLDKSESLADEGLIYIDQQRVGNNSAFLIQFHVRAIYSEKDIVFRFGSSAGAERKDVTYTLPYLPPDIKSVTNNSVIYGQDVYNLNSVYLTGEYVTDSIVTGGNYIYFKVGDCWYNLLDSRATDNTFLISANAEDMSDMEKLKLRYYYTTARKLVFE